MREIKFMAWNKKHKEFEDLEYRAFMNPLTGKMMESELSGCSDPECCGGPTESWQDTDDFVVEQFTGMKDKNGKEIYEGDLLRWTGRGVKENFNMQVMFQNGAWCAVVGTRHFWSHDICDSPKFHELEIVGNIHENQELLEGGK